MHDKKRKATRIRDEEQALRSLFVDVAGL